MSTEKQFDQLLDSLILLMKTRTELGEAWESYKGQKTISSLVRPHQVRYNKAKKDFVKLIKDFDI